MFRHRFHTNVANTYLLTVYSMLISFTVVPRMSELALSISTRLHEYDSVEDVAFAKDEDEALLEAKR